MVVYIKFIVNNKLPIKQKNQLRGEIHKFKTDYRSLGKIGDKVFAAELFSQNINFEEKSRTLFLAKKWEKCG
jgi:hypothetical protein